MRPTIRDVAREAGVSISTVSRVLNNTCPVNVDKKQRVEEAVQRLGYTPDPAARSLLKRETGGVGVLVPSVSDEYFSQFLTGIDRETKESGFYLLISSSHASKEEFDVALRSMHRRVDGLLVMAPDQGDYDPEHPVLQHMPVVYVNTAVDSDAADLIRIDSYDGFYKVTSHLVELGHRRLAHIAGPGTAFDATERLRAFRDALTAAGIPLESTLEVQGDFTLESGYAAVSDILNASPRPTAIAAANDQSALGALRALHEAGIKVPEEMSVSGFDDVPSARWSTPPLTTVRVQIGELGVIAIRHLIRRIRAEISEPVHLTNLPAELIVRESTVRLSTNGL